VHEHNVDLLKDAWSENARVEEKKRKADKAKRATRNWAKLVKSKMTRERLQSEFGDDE
jgi:hypothetical protein